MNTVDEKKAKEFMDAMVSFINGQVAEMKMSIRDEQQIRIAKLGLIQSQIKWLESLEATEKGDMPTALKAGSDASSKMLAVLQQLQRRSSWK
jgi:hypothetical protein